MNRRDLLKAAGLTALATTATAAPAFEHEEKTVGELQAAFAAGKLTSEALCRAYLKRIEALNLKGPKLRAIIEVNPDALEVARGLDQERKAKKVRGPLHGIPVVLKDNLDTGDRQQTSAGSLALVGAAAAADAFVVAQLRRAGAVVLGKTNLSEWANFRSTRANSGWSARGGLTLNPYALDRTALGSSSGSGVAVAANLCALAVGTETDGSVVCPAAVSGVVGLKPTVGLVSRTGIVPIAASQDTAGPIGRTVADVAALLGAMTGADPLDAATAKAPAGVDYLTGLESGALKGARLGVARNHFGEHPGTIALVEKALVDLKRLGAELVDPVDLPRGKALGDAEYEVLLYEFKAGIDAYLPGRRLSVKSLADLIAFNRKSPAELKWFGQEIFEEAQSKGDLSSAAYLAAVKLCREQGRDALAAALKKHAVDAIVCPTTDPAFVIDLVNGDGRASYGTAPAAISGFPSLTVPMGEVSGLPVGLLFTGPAFSEARLLALGYAYEQGTRHRRPPKLLPTLGLE